VFNLGLPDDHRNRLTATDVIDPIVLAKYAEPLSHCFEQGIRSQLDGMIVPARVGTKDSACAKPHGGEVNSFAFSSSIFGEANVVA
jgi:hypothetical protein